MVRRTSVHRRTRASQPKTYIPRSHDTLLTIALTAPNEVTFTSPERLTIGLDAAGATAIPQYPLQVAGAPPDTFPFTITVISATQFTLTYPAAAALDVVTIPAGDVTVRNYTGGLMTTTSAVLA